MDYLPAFHNVRGKLCLVVGGGEVATRKAGVLLEAGRGGARGRARDRTRTGRGSRASSPSSRASSRSTWRARCWSSPPPTTASVNRQVSELAQARNIPVNVVDDPELCSFIMPAILDRSPLMVAFSSGGGSPVLTRMMRGKLETMIPQNYSRLAAFAERFRELVKAARHQSGQAPHLLGKRARWRGRREGADRRREQRRSHCCSRCSTSEDNIQRGEVYLVGAGPGDPDLLTFRALRLMQKADVVVYDNLVSKPIVEMTRRDAQRIFVGKKRADHTMRQEEINDLLVRLAKEGKRVLRLKGGDPFIFGRGGEEIETLAARGYPVPGRARHHRSFRRRLLCRHPADASRSRAVLPVRHRPPQGRHDEPRLGSAGPAAPDRRGLHGPARP